MCVPLRAKSKTLSALYRSAEPIESGGGRRKQYCPAREPQYPAKPDHSPPLPGFDDSVYHSARFVPSLQAGRKEALEHKVKLLQSKMRRYLLPPETCHYGRRKPRRNGYAYENVSEAFMPFWPIRV